MKINTNYPINLQQDDKIIFDKVKKYSIKVRKIKLLKNVFVTNNGFVLKNGVLNPASGLNLKSKNDHKFYWEYWRTAMEQWLVCKFGKSLPNIHLKEKKYLLIHSKWMNYSFWITEYLQRLIRVEKEIGLENLILLYPKEWDNIPFIKNSLEAFSIEKFIIPEGTHLFIENLIFPEVREITSYFNPKHINLVRNRLIEIAKKKAKVSETPKKIYLTRGKNVKRAIQNEDELQKTFQNKGFEVVSFEKLTIWDQIIYMNNADIVFTNHGAGFSNVIFMKENKIALEFLERDFAYYANPFPHWKLAACVGVKYAYQLCVSDKTKNIEYQALSNTTGEERIEHVDRVISVNINKLVENIEFCENYLVNID